MGRHNGTKILLQQLERAKQSAEPLERLLSQSEAELQYFQEVETFERFIGDMALYFGNVFDAVVSYGKILQMNMDQDDPRQTYAKLILDDAKAGKRLTSDLLRRRGAVTLRLLTLDRFIQGLAPLLSRIVEKRMQLRTVRCAFQ
jgi:signal transduction histidine kinase